MSGKRRSTSDFLTGGTKDVSPQLFTINVTMSAANAYTQVSFPLPVNRFYAAKGKAVVIEFLRVYFEMSEIDANPAAGGSVLSAQLQLSSHSQATYLPSDPAVFAFAEKIVRGAFTAGGSYGTGTSDPIHYDLTDGAGHGFLVASDSVFVGMDTTGFTAAALGTVKVLYRFKEIPVEEYIGIVQSQQ